MFMYNESPFSLPFIKGGVAAVDAVPPGLLTVGQAVGLGPGVLPHH